MKLVVLLAVGLSAAGESRLPEPPLGLDAYLPVPDSNPLTADKVALGRKLFFDKALSFDHSLSCATCHDPRKAFSDGKPKAIGIHAQEGLRNSPAIINRGYGLSQFWDGRAGTLEQQVIEPILNPKELGLTLADLRARAGISPEEAAAALASYVRTIRSGNSRFDRYMAGDANALTPEERKGLALFRGKANCSVCHLGPNFTDEQFHNTGVAFRDGRIADEGRSKVTGKPDQAGAFKTPTLRDVARTGPYMHDGSLSTLEQVVDYYADGGRSHAGLDGEIRPLELSLAEKGALVQFLRSLDGEIREGWK